MSILQHAGLAGAARHLAKTRSRAIEFKGKLVAVIQSLDPACRRGNQKSLAVIERIDKLVDALYDRQRFLIASAASGIEGLYDGHQFAFEFDRTRSRLGEMTRRAG